jgi:hypothetical protein
MSVKVLFISENKLKSNTAINDNVDSSELRFCIQQAQQIQIQETLGTNLYNYLLELVDTGDIDLPANYRYKGLLDDYVQPTLISYAYYLALDNFWLKFINIGLVQNRSEQGQPVDLKTLQYLKTNANNQAEFNDNLMRRHLIFRSGWYPEYMSGNLNNGQLPPQTKSAFNSPVTLPGNGYYWINGAWNSRLSTNNNAMGPLCADSEFPTWYGHTNNS